MSDFTNKIKNLRLGAELTRSEIAEIIGCSQGHYLKMENDKVSPTVPILTALADYYKVSIDFLLNREVEDIEEAYFSKFPSRLKECRSVKGVTQREVADYIGLTVSTYQRYELGKREPNMKNFIKIANYFEVSTDYLLGRE